MKFFFVVDNCFVEKTEIYCLIMGPAKNLMFVRFAVSNKSSLASNAEINKSYMIK